MSIDVESFIEIRLPRADVGRFAFDPANDARWIGGVRWVRVTTVSPFGVGARVGRQASFLGRSIDYVMEIVEFQADRLLEMRTVAGPFPMAVMYRLDDAPGGARMTIRTRGDAGRFFALAQPLLAAMVRRNVERDLRTLKSLLESETPGVQ